MTKDFQGRIVLITGGTGALGSAVVKRLLDNGAVPHVTWILPEELQHIAHRDQVQLHQLDCCDEDAVVELYQRLDNLWASLHIIGGFAMAPIDQISARDMRGMLDLNLMTCFLCCREATRAFRRTNQGGRIVNVAARPAVQPVGGMVAYTTSKAAVASLTQCLAEEVKAEDVLVNAVLPSIMDTPANRQAMPDADHDAWTKVEQVAEAVIFLASPLNAVISGALVPVYGRV